MKKRVLPFLFAVVVTISTCTGIVNAFEDRASTTLSYYNIGSKEGDNTGEIKITYDVRANTIADTVGISSIVIYQSNGIKVETITGTVDNGLLRTDSVRHRSTYIYTGTSGVSYYASVTAYAEIGDDSDSRKVVTNSSTAP